MIKNILDSISFISSILTAVCFILTISDISKIKRNKINEIETKIKDSMLKIEIAELIVKK